MPDVLGRLCLSSQYQRKQRKSFVGLSSYMDAMVKNLFARLFGFLFSCWLIGGYSQSLNNLCSLVCQVTGSLNQQRPFSHFKLLAYLFFLSSLDPTFPTPYPPHVNIKTYIFCMCWMSLSWSAWIRNISGISYFFQVLWNMWDIREWINSKHEISLFFLQYMHLYISI